ncbi:NAD(P)-binding protein [Xylariaceae sp. FL0804]|nr:NAD(P)-binding protein [Xylariaceae sp. FL0804]
MATLIIGGGELGSAVLETLAAHPKRSQEDPRIDQETNARLRAVGADLSPGDVVHDSEADLAAIFRRYDTVVSCAGMFLPAGTQLKLTRAALLAADPGDAGQHTPLRRYQPWQWGLAVRALLRAQSRLDWLIVSVGLFTSFMFVPAFGPVDLDPRTVRALGAWDNRITLTTLHDIGRLDTEVLYDPRSVARQVVFIAGDTVLYARVAELVKAYLSGEWKTEEWDAKTLQAMATDRPDDGMVKYSNVFGAGKGVAWDIDTTLDVQRGIELQDRESYLAAMNKDGIICA